jgi:uncharacterized membrane protein YkvA (DUF1232 family)
VTRSRGPRPEARITIELNPRERRLYDRLRARVVEERPGTDSSLRDLLLLLPDLTVLLFRLLRDPRVPGLPKAVALLGLAYVASPIDLLPTFLFGPLGLVDDLLVVAATLSRLVNQVHPDVVRSQWSGRGDALQAVQGATRWSESLVRKRLPAALRGFFHRA